MKRSLPVPLDYIAAALVFGVGCFYLVGAYDYEMGSMSHMGPGFLPRAYGACAAVLGCFIFVGSFRQKTTSDANVDDVFLRSFLGIVLSIITFALVIPSYGLIPASFSTVLVASLGSEQFKPLTVLVLGCLVSISVWLIFSVMLGMPIVGFKGN